LLVALPACAGGARNSSDSTALRAEQPPPLPARLGIGREARPADVAAIDIDVEPDGTGLPPGEGTAARGAELFARQCATCHGPKGEGMGINPRLIGRDPREGFPFGRDPTIARTIGNYWPYATTIYDYVHRAMPLSAPGSLAPNEVYSLVAFLLAENEVIPRNAALTAK